MCIFSAQFLHFLNTVPALYERLNERHEEKSFPLISRLQKILLLTLEEKKKQPSSALDPVLVKPIFSLYTCTIAAQYKYLLNYIVFYLLTVTRCVNQVEIIVVVNCKEIILSPTLRPFKPPKFGSIFCWLHFHPF